MGVSCGQILRSNERFAVASALKRECLDDRHEDVDDVVAPVVLERRPRTVSIPPLRETVCGRADLVVDLGRLPCKRTQAYRPPGRVPRSAPNAAGSSPARSTAHTL
jgi:hypothetical protein